MPTRWRSFAGGNHDDKNHDQDHGKNLDGNEGGDSN